MRNSKHTKHSFIIYFLACILFMAVFCPSTAHASDVSNQILLRIRNTLNISSSISDDRLRPVLNKEVSSGVSLGNEIEVTLNQIDFGYNLKNGSYYTRYQDYFNNVLNDKLNVWHYWRGLAVGGLLTGLFGDSSIIYDLYSYKNDIEDISNLFDMVGQTKIDSVLREYINARISGASDADAWDTYYLAITLNVNLDKVHDYYRIAWEAYYLADHSSTLSGLKLRYLVEPNLLKYA